MEPLSFHTIPSESRTVAALVKNQLLLADATASVILFGSRARGDATDDGDWDFLVLTHETDTDTVADKLRKIMGKEIELKYDVAISLIVKNKALWESDYAITNIYESISEEGILLSKINRNIPGISCKSLHSQ